MVFASLHGHANTQRALNCICHYSLRLQKRQTLHTGVVEDAGDDDFVAASSGSGLGGEGDDEATLDEEERLAQHDANDAQVGERFSSKLLCFDDHVTDLILSQDFVR